MERLQGPREGALEDAAFAPRSKMRQVTATAAASLVGMAAGMTLPFEPTALTHLMLFDDELLYSTLFLLLGAVLGAARSGALTHFGGRKLAVACLAVPFVPSCILLLATHSVEAVYTARFLAGLGLGGVFVAVPIYVTEIADHKTRGSLGSLLQVMFNTGMLLAYVVGATGHYWLVNAGCLVVSLIFFAVFVRMPETPHFLVAKGRHAEAERSLRWLQGDQSHWQKVEECKESEKATWIEVLSDKATIKALGISLGLVVFQKLSDISDEAFDMEQLSEAAGLTIFPHARTVMESWVALLTSLGAIAVADRAGRRVLLLASSCAMASALGLVGLYYYLEADVACWFPLLCAALYTASYNVGLGPLPSLLMAELLPPNTRSMAGSIVSSCCLSVTAAVPYLYTTLDINVGTYFPYCFFAICCGLSAIYVAYVVPETKGKTLQQIQDELMYSTKTNSIVKKCQLY